MTTNRVRSRIAGLLTCGAALGTHVSLRFARSVLVGMLDRGGIGDSALSGLTVFALAITRQAILVPVLLACVAAIVWCELTVRTDGTRLLVQVAVLLLLVLLLAVALPGLLMPFHIPDVHIP
ncbi:MAG: hypothetical protein MUF10_00795 [Thermoanaerobaculaceae bacterium]|jgi:hypothetical protein|nr:hypothetical protein [Thermoanaerobaculaceae bacterium]